MTRFVRTIGTVVAAALALGACSSFTADKEKPVDENLFPKSYKAAILERLRAQLPDAKGIHGAFLAEPVLKPRDAITRYIACIRFDAKDDRGKYEGNKEYAAFFYAGDRRCVQAGGLPAVSGAGEALTPRGATCRSFGGPPLRALDKLRQNAYVPDNSGKAEASALASAL
jgi:hypothetical protein